VNFRKQCQHINISYKRKPNGRLHRINVKWNKIKRKNVLHTLSSATPKESSRNRFKCSENDIFHANLQR
jgi:hypothetical protein